MVKHFVLAAIAVGVGFVLSIGMSIVALRRRRLRTTLVTITGVIYTIPSLAMFAALVPVTGLSTLTAEIPLTLYTLLIFMRNILAGLDAVPAEVLEVSDTTVPPPGPPTEAEQGFFRSLKARLQGTAPPSA